MDVFLFLELPSVGIVLIALSFVLFFSLREREWRLCSSGLLTTSWLVSPTTLLTFRCVTLGWFASAWFGFLLDLFQKRSLQHWESVGYFVVWNFVLGTVYCAFVATLSYKRSLTTSEDALGELSVHARIIWVLHQIAVPSTILVFVIYWTAVYPHSATSAIPTSDAQLYIFNSAFLVAEFAVARTPMTFMMSAGVAWWVYVYTLFAVVLHALGVRWEVGGSPSPWPYPFLRTMDPTHAALAYTVIMVCAVAIYFCVYVLSLARDYLARRVGRSWEQLLRPGPLADDDQPLLSLPSLHL